MSRKLIVFGNGIGMALDGDYFNLEAAMKSVWEGEIFSKEEKKIISSLNGFDAATGPTDEDDLSSAYTALVGHHLLKLSIEPEKMEHWMTGDAARFPYLLKRYIYSVAHYFHSYEISGGHSEKWQNFTQNLIDHIDKHSSHVATLNYDTLLYRPFNTKMITGKNVSVCQSDLRTTRLGDGFTAKGYDTRTFGWYTSNTRGMYLHLHGTPLFHRGNSNSSTKLKIENLPSPKSSQGHDQIILGPVEVKQGIIDQCPTLKDYWEKRLPRCIDDAEAIILFGYGGRDNHLNELLKKAETKKKWIIEWGGSKHYSKDSGVLEGEEIDATTFWKDAVGDNCEVKPLGNILDFKEWDNPDDWPPF